MKIHKLSDWYNTTVEDAKCDSHLKTARNQNILAFVVNTSKEVVP